jgi:hypothetical protein
MRAEGVPIMPRAASEAIICLLSPRDLVIVRRTVALTATPPQAAAIVSLDESRGLSSDDQ